MLKGCLSVVLLSFLQLDSQGAAVSASVVGVSQFCDSQVAFETSPCLFGPELRIGGLRTMLVMRKMSRRVVCLPSSLGSFSLRDRLFFSKASPKDKCSYSLMCLGSLALNLRYIQGLGVLLCMARSLGLGITFFDDSFVCGGRTEAD